VKHHILFNSYPTDFLKGTLKPCIIFREHFKLFTCSLPSSTLKEFRRIEIEDKNIVYNEYITLEINVKDDKINA
jgi:hypothetical protein